MKFEEGKFYRTRDGRKAKIFLIQNYDMLGAVLWNGLWQHCEWYNCGHKRIGEDKLDLIEEWKEKVKKTVWTNAWLIADKIYTAGAHSTKDDAEKKYWLEEATYLGAHSIVVEVFE